MYKSSEWNICTDPISSRLRDRDELSIVQNTKSMIYHEPSKTTALIMDVWIVDPVPDNLETLEEDRYVRYTTETEVLQDFAIDLDEEGWLWYDELTPEEL